MLFKHNLELILTSQTGTIPEITFFKVNMEQFYF